MYLGRGLVRRVGRVLSSQRRLQPLGVRGERVAARYLKRRGFKIVATGSRDRLGEVDLIAIDRRTVVFVEVKTRRSTRAGDPLEAVDTEKQRRLTRVALAFLRRHDLLEESARFDVVGIVWPHWARRPAIEHIRGAFEPVGKWQMHA